MKISMWSGPRNLSTAMMYAFAQRPDCTVRDEPFYAAYLAKTGLDHPMRDRILAVHESDPDAVASRCSGPIPQKQRLFYMKHMAHHMLPGFPLNWARGCVNVFLIRHPARVVASYARKREAPVLEDLGFVQQTRLFDQISTWPGHSPIVIDSADIRANPQKTLRNLCSTIGIPFDPSMLTWPAGGHPADGIWAAHWYNAVHRSTGFDQPEGPLPRLVGHYATLAEAALPYYRQLAAQGMRPRPA